MSSSHTALDELTATVRREIALATRRLEALRARRAELQRELDAVTAAEDEGRRAVAALRSVAAHTSEPERDSEPHTTGECGKRRLAGGELRETIGRIALRRNAHGDEVHWRTWFGWLRADGFDAAGKRAEATFQTQLARSPLVRRADREGVYVLDVELLRERRDQLLALHERLAAMPPPEQLALMGDARAERQRIQQQIARAERALEEAWRTLIEELGPNDSEGPADAEHVLRMWRERALSSRDRGAPEPVRH